MPIFTFDVPVIMTAYVRADSRESAERQLRDGVVDIDAGFVDDDCDINMTNGNLDNDRDLEFVSKEEC